MSSLLLATYVLVVLGVVFLGVFSYFCLGWSGRDKDDPENIFASSVVSLLFSFKILLYSFFVVLAFFIILNLGLISF